VRFYAAELGFTRSPVVKDATASYSKTTCTRSRSQYPNYATAIVTHRRNRRRDFFS